MASRFAELALANIQREYPNKLDQVLNRPEDLRPPRALHPVFYGSYDWHSAVHAHWMLVRLLVSFPKLKQGPAVRAILDEHLTADRVAVEVDYLQRPNSESFERPYGWAWLLKLAEDSERKGCGDDAELR